MKIKKHAYIVTYLCGEEEAKTVTMGSCKKITSHYEVINSLKTLVSSPENRIIILSIFYLGKVVW